MAVAITMTGARLMGVGLPSLNHSWPAPRSQLTNYVRSPKFAVQPPSNIQELPETTSDRDKT